MNRLSNRLVIEKISYKIQGIKIEHRDSKGAGEKKKLLKFAGS